MDWKKIIKDYDKKAGEAATYAGYKEYSRSIGCLPVSDWLYRQAKTGDKAIFSEAGSLLGYATKQDIKDGVLTTSRRLA